MNTVFNECSRLGSRRAICLWAALVFTAFAGCASRNTAVFVTKTSFSVLDADTTPPTISVAYDRQEGFFGPELGDGKAPPVTGIFESEGTLFNRRINQAYATGNAAMILSEGQDQASRADAGAASGFTSQGSTEEKRRMMFVGTSTNLGLKLSFMSNVPVPTGFSLGFKRKEASVIPIAEAVGGRSAADRYPSVFAALHNDQKTTVGRDKSEFALQQVFATGEAAEHLALQLRGNYLQRSKRVVDPYALANDAQHQAAFVAARFYLTVPPARRPEVWVDAARLGLFGPPDDGKEFLAVLRQQPALADSRYVNALAIADVDDPARAGLLAAHTRFIETLVPTGP